MKSYGSIPHLPGSRTGPADTTISFGQFAIATSSSRDKHDIVIVQEKLDGSCVSVAKIDGLIVPLIRAGYRAEASVFMQHHYFAKWAMQPENYMRFHELLNESERACGEWLLQAHGTRYDLPHEPFVLFDIMTEHTRITYDQLIARAAAHNFITPNTVSVGPPVSITDAMQMVSQSKHGAIDPVEGAIWRVERNLRLYKNGKAIRRTFDFVAKYVRHDKQDGIYLPEVSGIKPIFNMPLDLVTLYNATLSNKVRL